MEGCVIDYKLLPATYDDSWVIVVLRSSYSWAVVCWAAIVVGISPIDNRRVVVRSCWGCNMYVQVLVSIEAISLAIVASLVVCIHLRTIFVEVVPVSVLVVHMECPAIGLPADWAIEVLNT